MIEILLPWVFGLVLLPLLFWWLLPPAQRAASSALRVPFYAELAELQGQRSSTDVRQRTGLLGLAGLIYVLLLLAAARPQWLGEPIALPVSGRDLMLAVDLSGSMEQADLQVNGRAVDRLSVVKAVLGEFIQRREGDRLGLILFGEQAYLQTPLTFDRETVKTLLQESVIGLAGQQTAIGDAIGLAVKRLRERPEDHRVLILLTDGSNNAGALAPDKAAELAAQAKVKIYTVGVGATQMRVAGFFGQTQVVNPSRDLDAKTLQWVADKTGGRYFRARDTQELERIYQLLDDLEPVEVDQQVFRPTTPLYPYPLGAALLLSCGLAFALGRKAAQ